jgi:hypothetical protein
MSPGLSVADRADAETSQIKTEKSINNLASHSQPAGRQLFGIHAPSHGRIIVLAVEFLM